MGIAESLVFYGLIGAAVATAVALAGKETPGRQTDRAAWWQSASAVVFWPIYLPGLLARDENTAAADSRADFFAEAGDAVDPWQRRIVQAERELDGALASLDGWAEEALAREQPRIAELRVAWRWQAAQIRELDRLLVEIEQGGNPPDEAGSAAARVKQCEAARRQNVARLQAIRTQADEDLAATLASVREIASMIHLAKFTGAPPSRADELVTQIAAAVEGLSEAATWEQRRCDAEMLRC
jgi:hypothetical protein